jgi:hypothetical protein
VSLYIRVERRANTVGLFLDFGQILAALATFVIRPVAVQLVLWLGRAGLSGHTHSHRHGSLAQPGHWGAQSARPGNVAAALRRHARDPHRPLANLGISLGCTRHHDSTTKPWAATST